jgi:hypothetical protein
MSRTVRVELTLAEAEALWVLIGQGRGWVLTDQGSIREYLGGTRRAKAAMGACDKFHAALDAVKHAACPRCGAKGKDLGIPFGGKPTLAQRGKS